MTSKIASGAIWYGGRHPSELTTEEFMTLHQTGCIRSDVYEKLRHVEGFAWLGSAARHPIWVSAIQTRHGEVCFRQSGQREQYVAHDAAGEILRDERGLALYLSDEEVRARGWATHDETIVAFLGDTPIGFVSNEWGAVGAWVAEPYQRCGIGTALVRRHLQTRPRAQLGQMTRAGQALARAVHRSFVHEAAAARKAAHVEVVATSDIARAA